jgi:hypothetical protein
MHNHVRTRYDLQIRALELLTTLGTRNLSVANRLVTLLFACPRSFRRLLIIGFALVALLCALLVEAPRAAAALAEATRMLDSIKELGRNLSGLRAVEP